MEDQLIRVDIYDKEVGYGTKEEVHRKGLLHRAFSVFLVDDDRVGLHTLAAGYIFRS